MRRSATCSVLGLVCGLAAVLLLAAPDPVDAQTSAPQAPAAPQASAPPQVLTPTQAVVAPPAPAAPRAPAAPPAPAPRQVGPAGVVPAPADPQATAEPRTATVPPAATSPQSTPAAPPKAADADAVPDDAPQAPVAVAAAAAAANPALRQTADQYCSNIVDAAADARFARQAETLKTIEASIEQRMIELEAKRAEFETWLARREAFLKKADENLIAIYSRMRAEAAAAQLGMMDDETAAAILMKLNPRGASAILNEMDPALAAQISNTIAGAARRPQPKGVSG